MTPRSRNTATCAGTSTATSTGSSSSELVGSQSPPVSEISVVEPNKGESRRRLVKTLCRLLAAPALTFLLSVCLTSRYVTVMIVFLLTSIKPLFYLTSSSSNSFSIDRFEDHVRATLRMQKAMVLQFAVLASFIWIYHKSTSACGGDRNVHQAFGNAKTIIEYEQYWKIDVEPSWQQAALPHTMAMGFFNQYYARTHFVVPILTAGYLLASKKDAHYFYRGSFALALVFALFGYTFIPTMPPRLLRRYANTYFKDEQAIPSHLHEWLAMIDSLRESESTYDQLHSAMGNPYAAMPSMHTGWATWSFLSVWDATKDFKTKQSFWRILLACHVLTIMYSTIVTANHYALDLVAGILCVVLGRTGMKWILKFTNRNKLMKEDLGVAVVGTTTLLPK